MKTKTIMTFAGVFASALVLTGGIAVAQQRPLPQIVNGQDATPHEFPWQVGLLDKTGRNYCGGAIVGASWILTAAHCLFDPKTEKLFSPSDIHVNVPVGDDLKPGEGKRYDVAAFFPFDNEQKDPKFPAGSYPKDPQDDIALIRLVQKIDVPLAVAIALDTDGASFKPSASVVVSGWGRTDPQKPGPSATLKTAALTMADPGTCAKLDPLFNPLLQVCTIAAKPTDAGTCYGDSGGPLVAMTSSAPATLGGVIEGGQVECAPGVNRYTSVQVFRPWIVSTRGALMMKY